MNHKSLIVSQILIHIIKITEFYKQNSFLFVNWLNSILYFKNIDIFYPGKRGPANKLTSKLHIWFYFGGSRFLPTLVSSIHWIQLSCVGFKTMIFCLLLHTENLVLKECKIHMIIKTCTFDFVEKQIFTIFYRNILSNLFIFN